MSRIDDLRALHEAAEAAEVPEVGLSYMRAARAAFDALPALLDVASAAETYARSGHRSGPTGCVVPAEDGGWICVCGLDALRAALDRLNAAGGTS